MNIHLVALMAEVVTSLMGQPLNIAPAKFIEILPVGASDSPPPHLLISEKVLGFRERYPELNDVVSSAVYVQIENYVRSARCIDRASPLLTQSGSMVVSIYDREHNKKVECGLTDREAFIFIRKARAEYRRAGLKSDALRLWQLELESIPKER